MAITPHPTADFKKPSIVHSRPSAEAAGLAYASSIPLITATAFRQLSRLPADKIIRWPTAWHDRAGVAPAPSQTSIKLFNAVAWKSHRSPASEATYSVPLNLKHPSCESNQVVVVLVVEDSVVLDTVVEDAVVVVVVVVVLVLEVVVVATQSANVLSWYRSIASFK